MGVLERDQETYAPGLVQVDPESFDALKWLHDNTIRVQLKTGRELIIIKQLPKPEPSIETLAAEMHRSKPAWPAGKSFGKTGLIKKGKVRK